MVDKPCAVLCCVVLCKRATSCSQHALAHCLGILHATSEHTEPQTLPGGKAQQQNLNLPSGTPDIKPLNPTWRHTEAHVIHQQPLPKAFTHLLHLHHFTTQAGTHWNGDAVYLQTLMVCKRICCWFLLFVVCYTQTNFCFRVGDGVHLTSITRCAIREYTQAGVSPALILPMKNESWNQENRSRQQATGNRRQA